MMTYGHILLTREHGAVGVINVPLLIALAFGLVVLGMTVVSGAINKLEEHGTIVDLRILVPPSPPPPPPPHRHSTSIAATIAVFLPFASGIHFA